MDPSAIANRAADEFAGCMMGVLVVGIVIGAVVSAVVAWMW